MYLLCLFSGGVLWLYKAYMQWDDDETSNKGQIVFKLQKLIKLNQYNIICLVIFLMGSSLLLPTEHI